MSRIAIILMLVGVALSGCANVNDQSITETSSNIPFKGYVDVRAGQTEYFTFVAPRDDALKFDYELLDGGPVTVCLMTTPSRTIHETGEDVPCGHEERLSTGGWGGNTDATASNDFDGGEYHVAFTCDAGSDDDCAVYAKIRHDDDEYDSTSLSVVGSDDALSLPFRKTLDLDPERSVMFDFQMMQQERLEFTFNNIGQHTVYACFTDAEGSKRLDADKAAKCLAEKQIQDDSDWESYLDLVPEEYAVYLTCRTSSIEGCAIRIAGETATHAHALADISGDTSPNGFDRTELPTRQHISIDTGRSKQVVFAVPDGQRLHYSIRTADFPELEGHRLNTCFAKEEDASRLADDLPVACEREAQTTTTSSYSYQHSPDAEHFLDLDQGWYVANLFCAAGDECDFVLELSLEEQWFHDATDGVDGKSPNGYSYEGPTGSKTFDSQPATRDFVVFRMADEGRITVTATIVGEEKGRAEFCLVTEDMVAAYQAGEELDCKDKRTITNTSSLTYHQTKTNSFFVDDEADWYAIAIWNSAGPFSYELEWSVS